VKFFLSLSAFTGGVGLFLNQQTRSKGPHITTKNNTDSSLSDLIYYSIIISTRSSVILGASL